MARITAPVPGYTGYTAGVVFTEGVGHADDPWVLGWLAEHGYQVEAPAKPEAPAKAKK